MHLLCGDFISNFREDGLDKIIDKDSETTKPLKTRLREEPGHITKACLNMCRQKHIAGLWLLVESATSLQRAVLIIPAKSGSKNKIVTTIKPGNIPLDQQHHGAY